MINLSELMKKSDAMLQKMRTVHNNEIPYALKEYMGCNSDTDYIYEYLFILLNYLKNTLAVCHRHHAAIKRFAEPATGSGYQNGIDKLGDLFGDLTNKVNKISSDIDKIIPVLVYDSDILDRMQECLTSIVITYRKLNELIRDINYS